MVTLLPERGQPVKDCILATLTVTLQQELADLTIKSPWNHFDRVTEVISALKSVVKSAIREFSEEWNAANGDSLISLPTELTLACFRLLDPGDRITVSHVSRRWRQTALAGRSLWNEYAVSTVHSDSSAADGITTLLARSYPLPFHFSSNIYPKSLPDAFFNVLCRNMHRMATLRIDHGFSRLAEQDAPILTHLTYVHPHTWLSAPGMPAAWAARHAPCLEYLHVVGIRLPANLEPIPTLRTFRAYFAGDAHVGGSFFAAFPNLTKLELNGVSQQSLQMLQFLPPHLAVLSLTTKAKTAIDYTSLLQMCKTRRILELFLDAAATFSGAVELFVQQSSDHRSLEITSGRVNLRDSTSAMKWSIAFKRRIRLKEEADHCAPQLQFFPELTLPSYDFLELQGLTAWNRQLPSLRSLTLSLSDAHHNPYRRADNDPAAIHLPALESVALRSQSIAEDAHLASGAPALLTALLENSRLPLASISLQPHNSLTVTREAVGPLLQLAERVVVAQNAERAALVFEA